MLLGNGRLEFFLSKSFNYSALCVINVFFQMFALDFWLGSGYKLYGLDVAKKIWEGKNWDNSARFPQVTLCDFTTRVLGNVQQYTVQCVLSINLFNEKIYLFVWFWLMFIAIVTSVNFLEWIVRSICFIDRLSYIKKHLKFTERYKTDEDKRLCRRFVNVYLRPDGVFMIRLLSKNTNSIIVSELVAALWDNYKKKHVVGMRNHLTPDNNAHHSNTDHTPFMGQNPSTVCPYGTQNNLHSRTSANLLDQTKLPTTLPFAKNRNSIQSTLFQPSYAHNPALQMGNTGGNFYGAAPSYSATAGLMSGGQVRKQIEAMTATSKSDILDV